MIPEDHPRYRSLQVREHLARCAAEGILSLEGLTAHGRGEAFDYLIGEKTMESASGRRGPLQRSSSVRNGRSSR